MLGDIVLWFRNKEYLWIWENMIFSIELQWKQFKCVHEYEFINVGSLFQNVCRKCGRKK